MILQSFARDITWWRHPFRRKDRVQCITRRFRIHLIWRKGRLFNVNICHCQACSKIFTLLIILLYHDSSDVSPWSLINCFTSRQQKKSLIPEMQWDTGAQKLFWGGFWRLMEKIACCQYLEKRRKRLFSGPQSNASPNISNISLFSVHLFHLMNKTFTVCKTDCRKNF